MEPLDHSWHRLQDFGQVAAARTTLPAGQLAAARTRRLVTFASANPALCEAAWWELVSQPKISADIAQNLCTLPLTDAQAEKAASDPRARPAQALLAAQASLPAAAVDATVAKVDRFPKLSYHIACSSAVPVDVARAHLVKTEGYYRTRAMAHLAARLPDDDVVAFVMDPAVNVNTFRYWSLARILVTRPSLTAALLHRISSGAGRSARENLVLLPHIAESRYLAADDWKQIAEAAGPKSTWSVNRVLTWAAVAGNPNTSVDGVQWALENLYRHHDRLDSLPDRTGERVSLILACRAGNLTPVTSDWDAPATPAQQRTVDALAWHGIVTRLYWVNEHPRWDMPADAVPAASRVPDVTAFTVADAPGRLPSVTRDKKVTPDWWVADQRWRYGMAAHAGTWIDTQMADADTATWTTLFALATDWDGNAADLIAAAKSL